MRGSLASRTKNTTKIYPVAPVSGSDMEMVPVDLVVKAEVARVGKN